MSGEKTEKATPKKRRQARNKGQVAKSQELSGVMVLMLGLVSFMLFGEFIYNQVHGLLQFMLGNVGQINISRQDFLTHINRWMYFVLLTVSPVFLFVVLAAIIFNVLQVGLMWAPINLQPQLNRLNPINGFKRQFSKTVLFNLFKNIMKLVVVGVVAYVTFTAEWDTLAQLGNNQDLMVVIIYFMEVCLKIFWRCVLAMLILAVLDWVYQKKLFEKRLKMSKQDIKDEFRQSEGDPHVKSRIRSLQRAAARKRMMASVPEADVVITNPTHLAVALAYKPGEMDAPQVTAKGANLVAERIKAEARAAGVPVIEDKPLAQALYKMAEVGQTIPYELYEAVAAILAHVYREKNRHEEVLAATKGGGR